MRSHIIDNWESQDEPEHWRIMCDRILKNTHYPVGLLELYQHILHHGQVGVIDSPEEKELLLSELVVKQQGVLKVHNRIYELIFDSNWVESCMRKFV
ncbi:hypothetical protein [Nostoc sp. FACHB-280]|uniref:hypothetical protein n=1 Tax=Nostoc sp. FACHB-280 TaxID=2692839 RepID=UPI00168B82DF|nr:hypothetical protein [Nostoc sp. FACHB-280]MBD2494308.1 hypothetical protein [Nostoc sp. FACHB-280]